MSDSVAEKAIQAINLKAIQRKIDEYAVDVISTTPRCAIYNYIEKQWKKSGIEGSLFIYKFCRPAEHNYGAGDREGLAFTILNKANAKTVQQDLSVDLEINCTEPYLLYK